MIDGTDRGETRRQHFYFLSSLVAFHLQREYLMGWSLVGCLWIESGIRKPKGEYRSLGGGGTQAIAGPIDPPYPWVVPSLHHVMLTDGLDHQTPWYHFLWSPLLWLGDTCCRLFNWSYHARRLYLPIAIFSILYVTTSFYLDICCILILHISWYRCQHWLKTYLLSALSFAIWWHNVCHRRSRPSGGK